MDGDPKLLALISVFFVLGSAFFVAAEYALVSARRGRVEAMERKGRRGAKRAVAALKNMSPLVAATQIGITMIGIAVGALTEPFVTRSLTRLLGTSINHTVSFVLSYLLITYVLVVIGELLPKYLVLTSPEQFAVWTSGPLYWISKVLRPLTWLVQNSAIGLLRLLGQDPKAIQEDSVSRDELLMLVRTGGDEGLMEKMHAEVVSRALKLNVLDARDIMIHRIDVKWLDIATTRQDLFRSLALIPHTRIPVCRGDIDDVAGIIYLHDIIKYWDSPEFNIERMLKPAVIVPENLSLDKIVSRMREAKTQILIVVDEYGGTSGLITLEDVVEEVFGELEDRMESERPPIEVFPSGRISAKGDVRFDELVGRLGIDVGDEPPTDTLSTIIVEALQRVPRPGDQVATDIGVLRVENMARRRITRVSLSLKEGIKRINLDL